jgi:Mg/Co/Ni transporter MgtE
MTSKKNINLRATVGFDMLVGDVMTTDVLTVQKFDSVLSVADTLATRNISGLPVVDKKGKVVGIITQADILSVVGVRDHLDPETYAGRTFLKERMGTVGDVMTACADHRHADEHTRCPSDG